MKRIFIVLLFACVVLAAGCISPAPIVPTVTTNVTVPVTAAPAVPDLPGTWTGSSTGYIDQSGYETFNDTLVMRVTSQDGSFFTGELAFPRTNGTIETKAFAGAIGPDGETIATIEYPGGFSNGVILSADEIQLVFRDQANPSTLSLDSLKRGTAAPGASIAVVPGMPDLRGTWNGTSVGYMYQSGYQVIHGAMTMEVTGQDNRFFTGYISYEVNGTKTMKEFAGVLGADGKTIETIELPDGFANGVVVSAGELELIFRDEMNPSTIAIDSFLRPTATLTPAENPAANLVGNWSGMSTGHSWNGSAYVPSRDVITLEVTGQVDRLFTGQVTFLINGTLTTKNIAGVFDRDGKTVETIEFPDGFSDGVVVSADEIQFLFRDANNPSRIDIDSFRRTT